MAGLKQQLAVTVEHREAQTLADLDVV
jgi:hypothetical protein